MSPFALLPTIDDDLSKMDSRVALRYQNTFMKNAIIRGLNNIYEQARIIRGNTHPSFYSFMEYAQVVSDMARLHLEGDEIFFTKRGPSKVSLDDILGEVWTKNPHKKKLADSLKALGLKIKGWLAKPSSYHNTELRAFLEDLQAPMTKGLFNLVFSIKSDIVSKKFTNEQMQGMIHENIVWLASHSDIAVLLPFCTSHHDPSTSKHWPMMTKEGLAVMPELVKQHANKWIFAPFDPVKKTKKKL